MTSFVACSPSLHHWKADVNATSAFVCEARLRVKELGTPSSGSLRAHVRAFLNGENSDAQWSLKDPFMNPVASLSQTKRGIEVRSRYKHEIQEALKSLPKEEWWKWLSVLLGHPQVGPGDIVVADVGNRPLGYTSPHFSIECRYANLQHNAEKSCIAQSKDRRIQMDFTLVDCKARLN